MSISSHSHPSSGNHMRHSHHRRDDLGPILEFCLPQRTKPLTEAWPDTDAKPQVPGRCRDDPQPQHRAVSTVSLGIIHWPISSKKLLTLHPAWPRHSWVTQERLRKAGRSQEKARLKSSLKRGGEGTQQKPPVEPEDKGSEKSHVRS